MSEANLPQNLFERPVYCGVLPLAWRQYDDNTSPTLSNDDVLRACFMLDDSRIEADEDDEHVQELQRIEQRLSLLMDLVGQMLAASVAFPEKMPCAFNALGAQWWDPRPPRVSDQLELRIFPDPRYPRPVIVTARVTAVEAQGERARVTAQIEDLGLAAVDWLDKLIMRQQRRRIAQTKRRR